MSQNRSSAVMQQRTEPHDSLDDFPTPPWATRACIELMRKYQTYDLSILAAREPCCNRGHMVRPLTEVFIRTFPSDVHDYGFGFRVMDYLYPGPMVAAQVTFMNPPFKLAEQFIKKSFETPHWTTTAALVRTSFLEGNNRYHNLFRPRPPSIVAHFVERVVMVKGMLLDPDRDFWDGNRWKRPSTATSYTWLIWIDGLLPQPTHWIAPCRKKLTREGDYPPMPRPTRALNIPDAMANRFDCPFPVGYQHP